MTPLRLGAVSYLNTKPLVYGLEAYPDQFEVRFDVPSQCATLLHEGKVDLGLIPAIEYLRGDYRIVPGVSIASDGEVATVAVFTRKPISRGADDCARFELTDVGGVDARAVREALAHRAVVHARGARSRSHAGPRRCRTRDWRSGICDRSQEARCDQDRSRRRVEGHDRAAIRVCDVGGPARRGDARRSAAPCRRRAIAAWSTCRTSPMTVSGGDPDLEQRSLIYLRDNLRYGLGDRRSRRTCADFMSSRLKSDSCRPLRPLAFF